MISKTPPLQFDLCGSTHGDMWHAHKYMSATRMQGLLIIAEIFHKHLWMKDNVILFLILSVGKWLCAYVYILCLIIAFCTKLNIAAI